MRGMRRQSSRTLEDRKCTDRQNRADEDWEAKPIRTPLSAYAGGYWAWRLAPSAAAYDGANQIATCGDTFCTLRRPRHLTSDQVRRDLASLTGDAIKRGGLEHRYGNDPVPFTTS